MLKRTFTTIQKVVERIIDKAVERAVGSEITRYSTDVDPEMRKKLLYDEPACFFKIVEEDFKF